MAIDQWCGRLADGLTWAAAEHGVPFSVRRAGSLLNVFLSPDVPPTIPERADGPRMARVPPRLPRPRLVFAPRGLLATSTVLSDELVDAAVERPRSAFTDLVEADAASDVEHS